MPASKKSSFDNDEQVAEIRAELELMVESTYYNTQPSFSANTERYPDSKIPFVEKHIEYLLSHKGLDPHQYISNLRLMTRIKLPAR